MGDWLTRKIAWWLVVGALGGIIGLVCYIAYVVEAYLRVLGLT